MTHPSCGNAGQRPDAEIGGRPIFRSAGAAVLSYDNQHIAAWLVHTRFPLPVRRILKVYGNGKRNHICRSCRRNSGAPCQAIQSSPCRPSGILRRQNAAAKNSFYTLCIIDEMNIASIFVIAQYCRPKSLRDAPK